ncbi:hypothetical protein LINGRAHAP2_LOCUS18730 [Linum grandiflorum]
MVAPLGPGKFYGRSLPRPRYVKFNSERVDPPVSVMDPFLSWANEAHWSMGGLNTERVRFQGRIEGNADRLRKFRENQTKLQTGLTPLKSASDPAEKNKKRAGSVSPPPAPRVAKKRKFMDLFDDGEGEEEEQVVGKKWPVRKLAGEFERVAREANEDVGSELVGVRTRRKGMDSVTNVVDVEGSAEKKAKKRLRKVGEVGEKHPSSVRSSPRLAKQ